MWKVGDVVSLESRTNIFYVYALVDDSGNPFYVGKTCQPTVRLRDHAVSGVQVVREALAACGKPRMQILAGPMSERDALSHERRLILSLPGLLNQQGIGRDIEKQREAWRRRKRRKRARLKAERVPPTDR